MILPLMVDFILTVRNDGCAVDEIGMQECWRSEDTVPLNIPKFITFRECFPIFFLRENFNNTRILSYNFS